MSAMGYQQLVSHLDNHLHVEAVKWVGVGRHHGCALRWVSVVSEISKNGDEICSPFLRQGSSPLPEGCIDARCPLGPGVPVLHCDRGNSEDGDGLSEDLEVPHLGGLGPIGETKKYVS